MVGKLDARLNVYLFIYTLRDYALARRDTLAAQAPAPAASSTSDNSLLVDIRDTLHRIEKSLAKEA